MIVCIAEKPSVARDIAALLGARENHSEKGIGYYEGNGYQVTWTFGHLCTLKDPADYRAGWKRWHLDSLPMIPERFGIKPIDLEHSKRQLEVIASLVAGATEVINCGDAGQEGELIQRWVLQWVGCKVPVKRLWVSSLTDESLKEGFAHLRASSDFDALYYAGLSRAIGDWLLGINATRLYTLRYGGQDTMLSVGRVQTPTLALVVERDREIEQFISETYWELQTIYRETKFQSQLGRIDKKEKAEALLAEISAEELEITKVKKKEGKELPPKLFDLTSLQVMSNRKFGYSAEETLKIIQSLYEKKITSYPRVDTTYLSQDIYKQCPNILQGLMASYASLIQPLTTSPLKKSKKVFDDSKVTDHHAIIPTGVPPRGLSEGEGRIYDLVARHFIAIFYPDCRVSNTVAEAKVGKRAFKATGKEILEPGWRIVFGGNETEEEAEDKEEQKVMPTFEERERGGHRPSIVEKQTQPPKRYTEATLLRAMETAGRLVEDETLRDALKENGIGRPSTRANIIETLFKRNYLTRQRKSLQSTPLGRDLIDKIQFDVIKSASLTGQWECKLRGIERKEIDSRAFLEELKAMSYALVDSVLHPERYQQTRPQEERVVCPRCQQGYLLSGNKAWGCSSYREGCQYQIPFSQVAKEAKRAELEAFVESTQSKEEEDSLSQSLFDDLD